MDNLTLHHSKKQELKKHVNAIHCSNNLTLVQRKLFNALLFNAYPELPHKQQFSIKGKELCRLIGYNSKDSAKLKNALLGLITLAIEWNVIDCVTGQEKKWKASSILASAELSSGICIYEYSQMMKEFLYQPEIYGRINIGLMSQFKSSYGLALYENCIRYRGLPQTPWFPLEIFRKLMGVFDDKYLAFKDLKKRVLDIAVREVNHFSPIKIVPEIERYNQKVTHLRFKLFSAQENIIKVESNDLELTTLLAKTFGFSPSIINDVLKQYAPEYIKEKIAIILQSDNFTSGKIRALTGYLLEALKKDYQPSKSSQMIIETQRKSKELKERKTKAREEKGEAEYSHYVTRKIDEYCAALNEKNSNKLNLEFENYLSSQNQVLQAWYHKHGLNHPATRAGFNHFILNTRQKELGTLLSKEAYIALLDDN